jgi:hypothetical protein
VGEGCGEQKKFDFYKFRCIGSKLFFLQIFNILYTRYLICEGVKLKIQEAWKEILKKLSNQVKLGLLRANLADSWEAQVQSQLTKDRDPIILQVTLIVLNSFTTSPPPIN